MREPDWEALSDLQFLLFNRIGDSLNAAVSAIALSDMPEAQDKPPGFWKERASNKISNVLNLFTAWSYLIRYKMGETIPERALRPFRANALLGWLGGQLQLSSLPQIESNPLLGGNQQTLQEALLLLYSAAFTQGSGVRLSLEASKTGMWFRVQFTRSKPLPADLDTLLTSFGEHWRDRDTAFELRTARDFVALNGSELIVNSYHNVGEFAFFVRGAGVSKKIESPRRPVTEEVPQVPAEVPVITPTLARLKQAVPDIDVVETSLTPGATGVSEERVVAADDDDTVRLDAAGTDEPAASAPAEPETPPALEIAGAQDVDLTPLIQEAEIEKALKPNDLPILRPLPRYPVRKPPASEGKSAPVEPQDNTPKTASKEAAPLQPGDAIPSDGAAPSETSQSAPELPSAPEPARKAESATVRATRETPVVRLTARHRETPVLPPRQDDERRRTAVIVPVKIPQPAPPPSLRQPPATTSGAAATGETQQIDPPESPEDDE